MLIAAVLAVASVRYVTSVPGVPHTGPLPALADAETAARARLAAHIRAIASRPHNIEHYDELEKARPLHRHHTVMQRPRHPPDGTNRSD